MARWEAVSDRVLLSLGPCALCCLGWPTCPALAQQLIQCPASTQCHARRACPTIQLTRDAFNPSINYKVAKNINISRLQGLMQLAHICCHLNICCCCYAVAVQSVGSSGRKIIMWIHSSNKPINIKASRNKPINTQASIRIARLNFIISDHRFRFCYPLVASTPHCNC